MVKTTVEELIKELSKLKPNLEVVVYSINNHKFKPIELPLETAFIYEDCWLDKTGKDKELPPYPGFDNSVVLGTF